VGRLNKKTTKKAVPMRNPSSNTLVSSIVSRSRGQPGLMLHHLVIEYGMCHRQADPVKTGWI
jgi:hypothetical protein